MRFPMRKPSFSQAEILAVLENCMVNISDFEPIAEGEESQAFRFRSETKTYVMRINKAIEGFQKDVFAHRRFARYNLPIPEVLRIEPIGDHFYCVSENLRGMTLQDLRSEQLPPLLGPVAHILDVIAKSDLDGLSGFGPFNAQGVGSYGSWRHFLMDIASPRYYDWNAVGSFMDVSYVHRLLKLLERLAVHCPETRRLLHGDFGSNNVLTNGSEITGVIDWSEALIGDPLYDVANIFFWSTWLECMRQQARYLENHLSSFPNLNDPLLCYQLRIGLAEVYGSAVEGKEDAAVWALSRCNELARNSGYFSR